MDKGYADTVRLLLAVAPAVFANDLFAMKGGTAINLFVQNMPRLSVRSSGSRCAAGPAISLVWNMRGRLSA
ncbi:hypothetical protein FQZ97_1038690 [compost metagenome]